eukprot:1175538-Rhodomonas_salina.2
MVPTSGYRKPAPTLARTSRTGSTKSVGTPLSLRHDDGTESETCLVRSRLRVSESCLAQRARSGSVGHGLVAYDASEERLRCVLATQTGNDP